MVLMHAFLPEMVKRNTGVICNIASMGGKTSTSKIAAYVANKYAIVGFTKTVSFEMKQQKRKVIINCAMPFYINTGMFDELKSRIVPILDPEKASNKIISNIEKGKLRTPMPLPYWFFRLS